MKHNNQCHDLSIASGAPWNWHGSVRWTFDRGAMPGEPFAFLDGNPEESIAAMFELQSHARTTVFEVRDATGKLLSRADDPSAAAMSAERRIDMFRVMGTALDERDLKILLNSFTAREQIERPRIGDFVAFATGQLERLSYDWDDGFQTSPGGAFFLGKSGHGSLSCGGLNPKTPLHALELTHTTLPGAFWFFHHGIPGCGRGVYFEIPCRVYKTKEPYTGFHGGDFASSKAEALKADLALQLSATSK